MAAVFPGTNGCARDAILGLAVCVSVGPLPRLEPIATVELSQSRNQVAALGTEWPDCHGWSLGRLLGGDEDRPQAGRARETAGESSLDVTKR